MIGTTKKSRNSLVARNCRESDAVLAETAGAAPPNARNPDGVDRAAMNGTADGYTSNDEGPATQEGDGA
jgi:hypothetical protein